MPTDLFSGSWISSIVSYISSSRYKAELPCNIKLPVMMKKYGLSFMEIDVVINSRNCCQKRITVHDMSVRYIVRSVIGEVRILPGIIYQQHERAFIFLENEPKV